MADLERELEKRRKAEALLLADWRMITSEPRRVQPRRFQETAKRLEPFRGPLGSGRWLRPEGALPLVV